MARARSPEREKAFELYKNSSGTLPLSDIAAQLKIPEGTVRGWKNKDHWNDQLSGTFHIDAERSKKEKNTEKKLIKSVESNDNLTEQRKSFCLYYSKTFNATMAYKKAFGCSYDTACSAGYKLLSNIEIRNEITRLKQIKFSALLASADDVVEKYMHIAFADISDYLEFGRAEVPVMGPFGPIQVEDIDTGKKITLTKQVNEVRFKESSDIDCSILSEVKQGKDGASVKLADKMKALEWLSNYFELNPADQHKREYDKRRLEIDLLKAQSGIKTSNDDVAPDDGFKSALDYQAANLWNKGDNANPEWEEQNSNDVDSD